MARRHRVFVAKRDTPPLRELRMQLCETRWSGTAEAPADECPIEQEVVHHTAAPVVLGRFPAARIRTRKQLDRSDDSRQGHRKGLAVERLALDRRPPDTQQFALHGLHDASGSQALWLPARSGAPGGIGPCAFVAGQSDPFDHRCAWLGTFNPPLDLARHGFERYPLGRVRLCDYHQIELGAEIGCFRALIRDFHAKAAGHISQERAIGGRVETHPQAAAGSTIRGAERDLVPTWSGVCGASAQPQVMQRSAVDVRHVLHRNEAERILASKTNIALAHGYGTGPAAEQLRVETDQPVEALNECTSRA